MPITCEKKLRYGRVYCVTDCPATSGTGAYRYARVEHPDEIPPVDERAIDIAILDMNHGWPNLGHDSIARAVRDIGCDLQSVLEGPGLYLRVISFDVRRKIMIPEGPGGRFAIYLGTGGPGHIEPALNDGRSRGSQGVREDSSWERPLFALFDAIREDPEAALLAVCHTFGVLCKWSGAARESLRGPEKGGKSSGVLENVLTSEALLHPWFARFAAVLPDGRRLRVVDNRLFDLVVGPGGLPGDVLPIAHETTAIGGPEGNALTMVEVARDREGMMPRMFATNHHPEIVDRSLLLDLLNQKLSSGEVTLEWYQERAGILTGPRTGPDSDRLLHITSHYTFVAPLQFYIYRQIRQRARALGLQVPIHEHQILDRPASATA